MKFDVCGLGNPLMDVLVYVDDDLLTKHGLQKGIMHLIEKERKDFLLELISSNNKLIRKKNFELQPGGACPNTIVALSLLGLKTALTGKIGEDELGKMYNEKIRAKGVESYLKLEHGDTGTSIILITPDCERTMNTYLGVSQTYTREDLPDTIVESSSIFYFTGYMWDTENQKQATLEAIRRAKESGTRVVFDLADPFAVNRYRDDFRRIIEEYIDIVLANAKEAFILTGETVEKSARALGEMCKVALVKNGSGPSYVCCEQKIISIQSFPTVVLDTTGAGDNYAAGFIYGIIRGYPLEICGKIASLVASKTIEKVGAQVPDNIKDTVEEMLKKKKY